MSIASAAENFINGNRRDVKEAMLHMQPLEAAAFAVRVYRYLGTDDGRDFYAWVQAIAD